MAGDNHGDAVVRAGSGAAGLAGLRVGNIVIGELLGQGGMSSVYSGFDHKLQRPVALKSIHPQYRLDNTAKNRFLREARILSQLRHPHICQIHDFVEVPEGDHELLVLELVEGQSLKQALRQGIDEAVKMRVAEQLVQVLIAAHGQGVIHRDLKPANVMLAANGDIKVLDFGLACSVDRPVSPRNPGVALPVLDENGAQEQETIPYDRSQDTHTEAGSVIGTVEYMSPEQARGEPATPASDMYSLGLMLQELFTGSPPYEPALPRQARLLKAARAETLPITGLDAGLTRLIERLQSAAPGARPSAQDTLHLLRYIRDRKKRLLKKLMTVAAVTLSLLAAAVMAFQARRIAQEAQRANREAEVAHQVSQFLVELFSVSDPTEARGDQITVRELLDRGTERIGGELASQPLVQARLLDTLGEVTLNLGQFDRAEPLLAQALQIRREQLGSTPDVAESLRHLAEVWLQQGRYGEAEAILLEALAIRRSCADRRHPDVADLLHRIEAGAAGDSGGKEEAWRARTIIDLLGGDTSTAVKRDLSDLGRTCYHQGRLVEAEQLFRRTVEMAEILEGEDHQTVAVELNNLAATLRRLGRLAESESLYLRSLAIREEVLGTEHYNLAHTLNNLAILYSSQGRFADAQPLYRRALEIKEKVWGADHPKVAISLHNLALNYRLQGRWAEAEPLFRRDLQISEQAMGEDHPYTSESLLNLAEVCLALGRDQEAAGYLRRALASSEPRFADDPSPRNQELLAAISNGLGRLHRARGQEIAARSAWQRALELISPLCTGSAEPDVLGLRATVLLHLGRDSEAAQAVPQLLARHWGGSEFRELCRRHGLALPAGS